MERPVEMATAVGKCWTQPEGRAQWRHVPPAGGRGGREIVRDEIECATGDHAPTGIARRCEGSVTSVSAGLQLVTGDSQTDRWAGWEEILGGRGVATATRRKDPTCTT